MTADREGLADRLDVFINALLPHWPARQGAVALLHADGSVEAWGFGEADASPDRLFQVGSITKSFVSVVVHQCVDEGLLSLDDDITTLLPWADLGAGGRPTRVRDLLAHTTGLILGGDGVPDEGLQLWWLRDLERSADPAPHFHYSNVGYMLLGLAVEAVTGRSFDEVVSERVLTPLGMVRSRGCTPDFDAMLMAEGTWPVNRSVPWRPGEPIERAVWLPTTATDGCVLSSARELAAFARLLLGDGSVDGVRLLSPESMSSITSPAAPEGETIVALRGLADVTMSRYGLGVNVEEIGGHHCVTHGGGMIGFQTFLLVDRTAGVAAVGFTNANGNFPLGQVIARAAHALLLDPDAALPSASDAVALPEFAEGWLGTFISDADPDLTIEVSRASTTTLTLRSTLGDGTLTRVWSGRFVCDVPGLRTFHWDAADAGWTHGPHRFRTTAGQTVPRVHSDVVGTYRSHTAWYPWLRVVEREGALFLAAPGGVEAPEAEEPLVPVGEGAWRIGADNWLPERLVRGPVVNGRAVSVLRDGVPYSRTEERVTSA